MTNNIGYTKVISKLKQKPYEPSDKFKEKEWRKNRKEYREQKRGWQTN